MLLEQSYELVDVGALEQHPENPRRGQLPAISESVAANGFYGTIVAQRSTRYVLAGNHRLLAAREQGLEQVPVVWVDVDDDRARRILLVDNKSADDATYDEAALLAILQELGADGLEGTGWSEADLIAMMGAGEDEHPASVDVDQIPDVPAVVRTKPGDLWRLGDHRLLCGDARVPIDVARLLDGRQVAVAFTSPPYASQRAYDASSGFLPIRPDDYVDWFELVQQSVRGVLADDGSWFVNIKAHCEDGQRVLYVNDLTLAHVRRWGWALVDEFCWSRSGVPGGWDNRFKNAWEPVFHFAAPGPIKFRAENVMVETDNAFEYRPDNPKSATGFVSMRGVAGERIHEGLARPSNVLRIHQETGQTENHTAPFPVALPTFFIRAFSDPGDVIFDPFLGSGTTLIAAHQEDRVGYGIEISPGYCDVICRRYQELTGTLPVLARTGRAVDFTTAARKPKAPADDTFRRRPGHTRRDGSTSPKRSAAGVPYAVGA